MGADQAVPVRTSRTATSRHVMRFQVPRQWMVLIGGWVAANGEPPVGEPPVITFGAGRVGHSPRSTSPPLSCYSPPVSLIVTCAEYKLAHNKPWCSNNDPPAASVPQ